jgi:hypothetical protein
MAMILLAILIVSLQIHVVVKVVVHRRRHAKLGKLP